MFRVPGQKPMKCIAAWTSLYLTNYNKARSCFPLKELMGKGHTEKKPETETSRETRVWKPDWWVLLGLFQVPGHKSMKCLVAFTSLHLTNYNKAPWRLASIVSRCGLAVRRLAGKQKDLGSIRFGSPFSSLKKLWFTDTVLWLCPHNKWNIKMAHTTAHLNVESFWWWQCNE